MKENYKVFNNGFNKILDLVETYNKDFYEKYQSIIDIVDDSVLFAVNECDDFSTGNKEYDVDFMRYVNAIDLDYTRKNKYLRSSVFIHRIFKEDLFTTDLKLTIFSMDQRNTKNKIGNIEIWYEEKNGKYNFLGVKQDIHYQIDLVMIDEEFYLVSKVYDGIKTRKQKIRVSFDEIYQYVENEDKYEEDFDVEFDADFDL